jgi:hypothetical protein
VEAHDETIRCGRGVDFFRAAALSSHAVICIRIDHRERIQREEGWDIRLKLCFVVS